MLYWLPDYMYDWMSADSAYWLEGLWVKCMRFQSSERYEWARTRESRQTGGSFRCLWSCLVTVRLNVPMLSENIFKKNDSWDYGVKVKLFKPGHSKTPFPVHLVSQVVHWYHGSLQPEHLISESNSKQLYKIQV